MVLWRALVLLLVLATAACASFKSRGDDAFARRDYATAAAFYESALREDPQNHELRKRLQDSRVHVLTALAAKAQAERDANRVESGLLALDELLAAQGRFQISGDEATGKRTVALVGWASSVMSSEFSALLSHKMPVAAERKLAARSSLLSRPYFLTLHQTLAGDVRAGGQRSCADAVSKSSGRPYFSRLAEKLCAHFGTQMAERQELANAVSKLQVRYSLDGFDDGEPRALVRAVSAGLQRSPAWDEGSSNVAIVDVSGGRQLKVSRKTIALTRPWVESVPYQATESYEEPYTEYYDDTESYSEEEPYTAYETRTRPCGNTVCSDSVPVTKYRTIAKTRPVKKSRTAYRTRERTVTRYRDVPREFHFQAQEVRGVYDADVAATVVLPVLLVPTRFARHDELSGLDHDASFPAAGVSPSRANLPSVAMWFEEHIGDLAAETTRAVRQRWEAQFCQAETYDLETAALCARSAGLSTPAQAKAALAAGLGPEVDGVLGL